VWGGFCTAAPGHGSLLFLYHVGRVWWVWVVSVRG
jgi:hypothetical protein